MNPFLLDVLYIVSSYFGVVFVIFFLLQWQTKGFVGAWLRVKTSKGKKTLTIIHTRTDTYYKPGIFKGDSYTYKGRDKEKRTYAHVPRESVYGQLGVYCLEVDEVAKQVIDRLKLNASEQDPIIVDTLIQNAIEGARLQDNNKKIMLALAVAAVLGIVAVGYMVYLNGEALTALEQISGLVS